MSTDSVRCNTGIQELIADLFLLQACIIFVTSSEETSLNWNFFCILHFPSVFKTLKRSSYSFSKSCNDLDLGIEGFKFKMFVILGK